MERGQLEVPGLVGLLHFAETYHHWRLLKNSGGSGFTPHTHSSTVLFNHDLDLGGASGGLNYLKTLLVILKQPRLRTWVGETQQKRPELVGWKEGAELWVELPKGGMITCGF